jgi:hypothetical protein
MSHDSPTRFMKERERNFAIVSVSYGRKSKGRNGL